MTDHAGTAPYPIVGTLETDGQPRPLTDDSAPALMELLTHWAGSGTVFILERNNSDAEARQSPALGWQFNPGDYTRFAFYPWSPNDDDIALASAVIMDGHDPHIEGGGNSPNCSVDIPIVPGLQYAIVPGRVVHISMGSGAGLDVVILFVQMPAVPAPETASVPASDPEPAV